MGHVGHVQQVLPLPPDFEPDDVPGLPRDNTDTISVASGRSSTPALGSGSSSSTSSYQHHDIGHVSSSQPVLDEELRAAYGPGFETDLDRPLPCRYILTAGLDSTIKLWDTASVSTPYPAFCSVTASS